MTALLGFDVAFRAWQDRAGATAYGSRLGRAGAIVRREVARLALAEAAKGNPRQDLAAVLGAALDAGVDWQDIVGIVNDMRARNPGRG